MHDHDGKTALQNNTLFFLRINSSPARKLAADIIFKTSLGFSFSTLQDHTFSNIMVSTFGVEALST